MAPNMTIFSIEALFGAIHHFKKAPDWQMVGFFEESEYMGNNLQYREHNWIYDQPDMICGSGCGQKALLVEVVIDLGGSKQDTTSKKQSDLRGVHHILRQSISCPGQSLAYPDSGMAIHGNTTSDTFSCQLYR